MDCLVNKERDSWILFTTSGATSIGSSSRAETHRNSSWCVVITAGRCLLSRFSKDRGSQNNLRQSFTRITHVVDIACFFRPVQANQPDARYWKRPKTRRLLPPGPAGFHLPRRSVYGLILQKTTRSLRSPSKN